MLVLQYLEDRTDLLQKRICLCETSFADSLAHDNVPCALFTFEAVFVILLPVAIDGRASFFLGR